MCLQRHEPLVDFPPASLDRAGHCPFLSQSLSLGEDQSQPGVVGVSESVTDTEDELSQVVFISQAPPFSCFRGPAGERPKWPQNGREGGNGVEGGTQSPQFISQHPARHSFHDHKCSFL